MNEFRADLHCHTTCSDGSEPPEKVIRLAKEIGLSGLSITDHDSTAAYETAYEFAGDLKLLPGVEFSTMHKGVSIHLLAYGFVLNHPAITELCTKHHERREARNREILYKLAKHDMPVTEEEIATTIPPELREKHRTIGRPHIAYVMLQKGYVDSITEAFKKWIGEGRPCFATGISISTEDTIDIIHEAKGLAIIAHPHLIDETHVLGDLYQMKFDGIECYYARFAMDLQQRWIKVANRRNWIITGGSDFHGTIKPNIPLGCSWVNEELFTPLWLHHKQNNPQ